MSANVNKKRLDPSFDSWFQMFRNKFDKFDASTKIVFISDCDGTMTDGRSYYKDDKELKAYCSYDREAVDYIVNQTFDQIHFVTGDKAGYHITENRIKTFFWGQRYQVSVHVYNSKERVDFIKEIKEKDPKALTVFIGDALSDIVAMSTADVSMTVSNAPDYVKEYCDYISPLEGGHGGFADCIFAFYKWGKTWTGYKNYLQRIDD